MVKAKTIKGVKYCQIWAIIQHIILTTFSSNSKRGDYKAPWLECRIIKWFCWILIRMVTSGTSISCNFFYFFNFFSMFSSILPFPTLFPSLWNTKYSLFYSSVILLFHRNDLLLALLFAGVSCIWRPSSLFTIDCIIIRILQITEIWHVIQSMWNSLIVSCCVSRVTSNLFFLLDQV